MIIKDIKITNSTILSTKQKDYFTKPYINNCAENIDILMDKITKYYINKGYMSSRAVIDKNSLRNLSQTQIITIKIIEGKIEEIVFDEESKNNINFFNQTEILTAFGHLKGKILNIRDIEQGIEQFDAIKGSKTTMQIKPSSKLGFTKVVLKRQRRQTGLNAKVTIDNLGSESTGKKRRNIGFESGNILHLNENFYVSGRECLYGKYD